MRLWNRLSTLLAVLALCAPSVARGGAGTIPTIPLRTFDSVDAFTAHVRVRGNDDACPLGSGGAVFDIALLGKKGTLEIRSSLRLDLCGVPANCGVCGRSTACDLSLAGDFDPTTGFCKHPGDSPSLPPSFFIEADMLSDFGFGNWLGFGHPLHWQMVRGIAQLLPTVTDSITTDFPGFLVDPVVTPDGRTEAEFCMRLLVRPPGVTVPINPNVVVATTSSIPTDDPLDVAAFAPCRELCGNGAIDPGEQCEGTDAAACPSACRPDCTCPGGPSTTTPTTTTTTTTTTATATTTTTTTVPPVAFVACRLERVEVDLDHKPFSGEFRVSGQFALGRHSNGIDPVTEPVAIAFGGHTETILPGSFRRDGAHGDERRYSFTGPSGGVTKVEIEGEGRRFEFEIRANGVELSEISLRGIAVFRFDIGDDFCKRTVSLSHNGRRRH